MYRSPAPGLAMLRRIVALEGAVLLRAAPLTYGRGHKQSGRPASARG
jgi:hypothetical protein